MKNYLVLIVGMFFCFSIFAKVNIKLDYRFSDKSKSISISKDINISLDDKVLLDIPGQKYSKIELLLTQKYPKELSNENLKNSVLVNMRLLDFKSGEEIVISSPSVLTKFGSHAELEMLDREKAKTQIKLSPTKI